MGNKRVMVFGVFDGCDKGHQFFLHQAAEQGDELVVVVARDNAVEVLKHKCPFYTLKERIQAVEALGVAAHVVPGDEEQQEWLVVETYKPDMVVLGHDQQYLMDALSAHYPDMEMYTVATAP